LVISITSFTFFVYLNVRIWCRNFAQRHYPLHAG